MNLVHVHSPPTLQTLRRVLRCRQCRRRRVHAVFCYEWYDPSVICATCGRDYARGGYVRKKPDMRAAAKAKSALMKGALK